MLNGHTFSEKKCVRLIKINDFIDKTNDVSIVNVGQFHFFLDSSRDDCAPIENSPSGFPFILHAAREMLNGHTFSEKSVSV